MGAEPGPVSRTRLRHRLRCFVLAGAFVLAAVSALSRPAHAQSDDGPVMVTGRDSRGNDPTLGVTLVDDRTPTLARPETEVHLPQLDLQGRIKDIVVAPSRAGDVVRVKTDEGWVELTPEQYVRALHETQLRVEHGGFLYRWLNISKPASFVWISVGLLGQVMFTFRMVLQWLASEKHKRSIVPVGFWWGSLIGGAMLFAYFCWRKDVVGIIGQSTGVFIYARNLVLIYSGKRIEAEGARPVGEDSDEHRRKSVATPHAT